MVRIKLDDVEPNVRPHCFRLTGKNYALQSTNNTAEAFSHTSTNFIVAPSDMTHPLVHAVHEAFAQHLPLIITPDAIFSTIAYGISEHVEKHAEELRDVFVQHKGKKNLTVRDDDLVRNSWDNRWSSVIAKFKAQLLDDMSGKQANELLKTSFSTTTEIESTAHALVFMDIVKSYYEYTVMTMCGIPYIEIAGEKEDWERLSRICQEFLPLIKLDAWNDDLQGILQHFISAFDPDVDTTFWKRIYKYHGAFGSGGVAKATGWISRMFLYIRGNMNPRIGSLEGSLESRTGIPLSDFPSGLTQTPFKWEYYNLEIPMFFRAGLVGVSLDDNILKPEVGWLIAHKADDDNTNSYGCCNYAHSFS